MSAIALGFLRDERGLEEVEVGIVAALLVVIGALIFFQIAGDSKLSLGALEKAVAVMANQSAS